MSEKKTIVNILPSFVDLAIDYIKVYLVMHIWVVFGILIYFHLPAFEILSIFGGILTVIVLFFLYYPIVIILGLSLTAILTIFGLIYQ